MFTAGVGIVPSVARTFTLIRKLGQGVHGSVHLAEVRDDDNYVQTLAIKRLHPDAPPDPPTVDRLEDEARLLRLLKHDNIVPVHGLTRVEGGIAILMEPVHGVDLARLSERVTLPDRVITEIVVAVADALDAAWNAQPCGHHAPLRVAHRDLEPSNVLVTPRGAVRLVDFGVPRADASGPWAPPEPEPGPASDIFSLGMLFAALLTGQAPAPLRPDAFDDDRAALLDPIAIPELRELIEAMTARDPADRPEAVDVVTTALALLPQIPGSDLRTWATHHVVVDPAEADEVTVLLEDTASHGLPVLTPVPATPRREGSWSWLANLVGFAGMVGLAFGWAFGTWADAHPPGRGPSSAEAVLVEADPMEWAGPPVRAAEHARP